MLWRVAYGCAVVFLSVLALLYRVREGSLVEMVRGDSVRSPTGAYRLAIFVHTFPDSLIPTMPGDGIGNRTATVRLLDRNDNIVSDGCAVVYGRCGSANELRWSWTHDGVKFDRGELWRTPTVP